MGYKGTLTLGTTKIMCMDNDHTNNCIICFQANTFLVLWLKSLMWWSQIQYSKIKILFSYVGMRESKFICRVNVSTYDQSFSDCSVMTDPPKDIYNLALIDCVPCGLVTAFQILRNWPASSTVVKWRTTYSRTQTFHPPLTIVLGETYWQPNGIM